MLGLLHLFSFPSRIFSSSSDIPTFQTIAILSYFWWLLSTFHIRIKMSTTHIYIYNSVLTCRQHIINSSESAPPNATKIAVKKVSDVDVCMFGPELQLSMHTCCFLACFCARQRARWLRAELTYHTFGKSYQTAGPIDTKFRTHVQINLGMDICQTK